MENFPGTRLWLFVGVLIGVFAVGSVGLVKLLKRDQPVDVLENTNPVANGSASAESEAGTTPDGRGRKPLFDEVSAALTGVDFTHRLAEDHPLAYLYHSGYTCGGVCLGDVNGDGLCDIFLVSGPDENALFVNTGGLSFEKSPASATLGGGDAWGVGASMIDVDGDGDLDLYVCNYDAPNRLWLNDGLDEIGRLQFTECAEAAGLSYAGPSQCPYFADFDADGDLDCFLLTNRLYAPDGRPRPEVASKVGADRQSRIKEKYARYLRVVRPVFEVPGQGRAEPPPFMLEYGHPDRVYRNDGKSADGVPRFQDVTSDSGFEDIVGHGLSALIWDVNEDGRPDIFVANDYTDPDRLWINVGSGEDGGFRFQDMTDAYLPYTTWSSMGSDVADVDGDGRLDFLVADMAGTTHFKSKTTMGEMSGWRRWVLENGWPRQAMRNMLFVNSGAGRYLEAGYLAGVAKSNWTWAVRFADYDLDGKTDLFLTNGSARVFADSDIIVKPTMLVGQTEWEIFRDKPELHEQNLAFQNGGGLNFTDVSRKWNLDKEGMSYGAAAGDLDGDGDLDLVVCNLNDEVSLYRNRATESGAHWLRVRLEGDGGNRFGWGAVVTAKLENGSTLVRLMNPQTGFLSGNEPVLHFGLGTAEKAVSLEVRWPDGSVQRLGPQQADQLIVVRQSPDGQYHPDETTDAPRFAEVAEEIGLDFKHRERYFDDYRREFLLPGQLSRFGPGLAVADVNGDGLDDVFVGGAAGQAGALFVHQADHTFRRLEKPPWDAHSQSEEMGALFFDADRDGDLDLYVVHGSNEWDVGDRRYADKLYLNQSQGDGPLGFAAAEDGALPDLRNSGSCVVGADFDRDGDVDLFVGSRSVPGQYPIVPDSTLLRNDGTQPGEVKFSDVTDEIAPALRRAGLVTGALWSDADGDGRSDLLVTSEWGPVKLFLNQQGRLIDATDRTALAERYGWWNSITGADFDGDGDIDYVALNVGLNTKYGRATAKKPAILYRGDMDDSGGYDLVEAKSSSGGELPVRGRSCSSNAMPVIRERFPTYKEFAEANLVTIYSEECLSSSEKVVATEFESGLWINQSTPGEPRFTWQALPVQAQISPCFGAVAADFYGHGTPDVALAQNLFSREPETGLWRGGLGCMLRTENGGESFTAVAPNRSGFVVAGDGKSLAVADLNGDGRPDLVATQNNDAVLAFQAAKDMPQSQRPFTVRLAGSPGNPLGFGARVRLLGDGQILATTEIHGGSGYLSQSAPAAFFVLPSDKDSLQVRVQWPGGEVTTAAVEPGESSILARKP